MHPYHWCARLAKWTSLLCGAHAAVLAAEVMYHHTVRIPGKGTVDTNKYLLTLLFILSIKTNESRIVVCGQSRSQQLKYSNFPGTSGSMYLNILEKGG